MSVEYITTAVELGKAVIASAQFQCLVTIQNDTDSMLVHQAWHEGHGQVNTLTQLPEVAPRRCLNGKTYVFDEVVPITNNTAGPPPGVVMVWKLDDKNVWLVVVAWMGGAFQTNAAFYQLRESAVEPADFWANLTKNETWFYVGDVKEHCDTNALHGPKPVQGLSISGSANNENPMNLTVTVSA